MNCCDGVCKYLEDENCKVDGNPCNYKRELNSYGAFVESCRQENNPELQEIARDCFLMENPPQEPFFSCYNRCKKYHSCNKA